MHKTKIILDAVDVVREDSRYIEQVTMGCLFDYPDV